MSKGKIYIIIFLKQQVIVPRVNPGNARQSIRVRAFKSSIEGEKL